MDSANLGPGMGADSAEDTCSACGRTFRKRDLRLIDGRVQCGGCVAEARQRAARRRVRTIAVIAALVLLLLAVATPLIVRAMTYPGSPQESVDAYATFVRNQRGTDLYPLNPVFDPYIDQVKVYDQVEKAIVAQSGNSLAGKLVAPAVYGSFVVRGSQSVEIVDVQGDVAKAVTNYTADRKSDRVLKASLTLTKVTDEDGERWRITSVDNAPELASQVLAPSAASKIMDSFIDEMNKGE